jgi:hypothetical protein
MKLTQDGTTIKGTYGDGGEYTITGTVSNNKLTGKYSEESSGQLEFYMNEEAKSFQGWYGDDQTPKQDWSSWNGDRSQ